MDKITLYKLLIDYINKHGVSYLDNNMIPLESMINNLIDWIKCNSDVDINLLEF